MTLAFPRPPGRDDISGDAGAFVPLARLAALSESLAAQPLGPSAAFRERLRADLLAEAASDAAGDDAGTLAPVRALDPPHRHPALRGAAAGIALVLAGGGVAAAAAEHSLPGDTLHPLKRFTETVRTAADPHRDAPSHVLGEIDVRLSELERSSRLGAGAASTGIPLDRWPAMQATLSEVESDLARLEARESDPAVREALAQRRQRLVGVLPALTAQQQPAVEHLVAVIDAMTLQPGVGGTLSMPAPVPGQLGPLDPALAGGVDDVLTSMRRDQVTAAAVAAGTRSAGRPVATSNHANQPATRRTTAARGTRTKTTGTRTKSRAARGRAADGRVTSVRAATATAAARSSKSVARTVRTVTVTITTVKSVTTQTPGTSPVGATGPASTSLPTVTTGLGSTTSTTSQTVSTTTRTVSTSVLPPSGTTSALDED